MQDGGFLKPPYFSNVWCFLKRFFTEELYSSCRIVFRMFLAFLIFHPNRPFYKGNSLCKMGVFQNRLFSGIFGVFSSGFLHRTTVMLLLNPLCKGYSLCKMADFQTRLISPIFGVFWSGFLHRTTLMTTLQR